MTEKTTPPEISDIKRGILKSVLYPLLSIPIFLASLFVLIIGIALIQGFVFLNFEPGCLILKTPLKLIFKLTPLFSIFVPMLVLSSMQERINKLFKKIIRHWVASLIIFLVILYCLISWVFVVKEDKFIDYTIPGILKTEYSLEDVKYVETGFVGKDKWANHEGDFYYIVHFDNLVSYNINGTISSGNSPEDFLVSLDEKLMNLGIPKISSDDYIEKCTLNEEILNKYKKIIENKGEK